MVAALATAAKEPEFIGLALIEVAENEAAAKRELVYVVDVVSICSFDQSLCRQERNHRRFVRKPSATTAIVAEVCFKRLVAKAELLFFAFGLAFTVVVVAKATELVSIG